MSNLSTNSILSFLSKARSNANSSIHSSSSSAEIIIKYGKILLERNYFKNSPEDGWNLLEQLCIASIECQEFSLAIVCYNRLEIRFTNSPRVNLLKGLILEGKQNESDDDEEEEGMMKAELYYVGLINKSGDEGGNILIRKRRIALHLNSSLASVPSSSSSPTTSSNTKTKGLEESIQPNRETGLLLLLEHLNIFYNDLESWSCLADIYSSFGLYQQSLKALDNLIILQPLNSIYLLKHSETLFTLEEFNLAYFQFLRVIEMDDTTTSSTSDDKEGGGRGVKMRACLGAKLCLQKLSTSNSTKIKTEINLFLIESILNCSQSQSQSISINNSHSKGSSGNGNESSRKLMRDWLST